MFNKKLTLAIVASLALSGTAMAHDHYQPVQRWQASITNNQRVCGIEPVSDPNAGGILVKGERGTDGRGSVKFTIHSNMQHTEWSVIDAHIVSAPNQFVFSDDLSTINDTRMTSVYVNDREYSWSNAAMPHALRSNYRVLNLEPKINMDRMDLPFGQTTIQGKLRVICHQ